MDDRDELIRRRAYAIWENEGRPEGDDRRHWDQASREMGEASGGPDEESQAVNSGTVVGPAMARGGKARVSMNRKRTE